MTYREAQPFDAQDLTHGGNNTPGESSRVRWEEGSPLGGRTADVPLERFEVLARVAPIGPVVAATATVREIYPGLLETESNLKTAVTLLDDAARCVDAAITAVKEQDFIGADCEMQQVQGVLPELFCCRGLGDGFGTVINGLQIAYANRKGLPFEGQQIEVVGKAIHRLRGEPFLTVDQAVETLASLEDGGLVVEPPDLAQLADLSDEQGLP